MAAVVSVGMSPLFEERVMAAFSGVHMLPCDTFSRERVMVAFSTVDMLTCRHVVGRGSWQHFLVLTCCHVVGRGSWQNFLVLTFHTFCKKMVIAAFSCVDMLTCYHVVGIGSWQHLLVLTSSSVDMSP